MPENNEDPVGRKVAMIFRRKHGGHTVLGAKWRPLRRANNMVCDTDVVRSARDGWPDRVVLSRYPRYLFVHGQLNQKDNSDAGCFGQMLRKVKTG